MKNAGTAASANGASAPEKHRGLREPWKPGESGNPAGRPKGSRNKLSEEFVTELYADWREHGSEAIKSVRETRPDVYVKVVASLLPRQIEAEVTEITHEDRVAERAKRIADYESNHRSVSEARN